MELELGCRDVWYGWRHAFFPLPSFAWVRHMWRARPPAETARKEGKCKESNRLGTRRMHKETKEKQATGGHAGCDPPARRSLAGIARLTTEKEKEKEKEKERDKA